MSRVTTPLAVILAPTRELAMQIYDEARKFSQGTPLRPVAVYGGASFGNQLRDLKNGICDIIVATPGRLNDFFQKKFVSFAKVKFLVLDEADRMLDMGFEPQIREIVEKSDMPHTKMRQTLLFSATFPKEIQALARSFLNRYIFLTIGPVGAATESVTQNFIYEDDETQKEEKLKELIRDVKGLTLVFVETKKKASEMEYRLGRLGFGAISIHGDKEQHERTRALKSFSSGATPILIATNVAARGIDIGNIEHVVNYEMPKDVDDYVHRIGRTGRIGRKGLATSFISSADANVAPQLALLLRNAGQPVPDFLNSLRPMRGFKKGQRNTRRWPQPSFGNSQTQQTSWNNYSSPGAFRPPPPPPPTAQYGQYSVTPKPPPPATSGYYNYGY